MAKCAAEVGESALRIRSRWSSQERQCQREASTSIARQPLCYQHAALVRQQGISIYCARCSHRPRAYPLGSRWFCAGCKREISGIVL